MASHVPVPTSLTGTVSNPYGKPAAYFERSIFSVHAEGSDGTQTVANENTSVANTSIRTQPYPGVNARLSPDISHAEALRNPDVLAAFEAAERDQHAANPLAGHHNRGPSDRQRDAAQIDDRGSDGRGRRRRDRQRIVTNFEYVSSSSRSSVTDGGGGRHSRRGSGSDLVHGVPVHDRTRRPRRDQPRLVERPYPDGSHSDINTGSYNVSYPYDTGDNGWDRSSRGTSRGSSIGKHSRHSASSRSTSIASSVAEEIPRRLLEVHDGDCDCALCEERRRQAAHSKGRGTSRLAIASDGCGVMGACSTM